MEDYLCTEEMFMKCKKNALCHLCDGERLYTPPKERPKLRTGPKKKKEGMDFEKKVTKAWNKSSMGSARRQPNSGAIAALPGDIVTPNELMECKERGTVNSKGEKNFTIQKDWLDKVRGEALRAKKDHWYLPFGFKGDNEIFLVKSFEHELELLQIIESLRKENEELRKKVGE